MAKKIIGMNLTGKTLKFIGAQAGKPASGIGLPIGHMVTISSPRGNAAKAWNLSSGGWLYEHELELPAQTVDEINQKIASLNEEITSLREEIKTEEDKLAFMKENKLVVIDEESFKAYKVLKVLNLGSYDQAIQIIKILK